MEFLKPHYDTEGPFGLPMKDAQAQALEEIIKTLPQPAEPKFVTMDKAPSELLPGERADVSWISRKTWTATRKSSSQRAWTTRTSSSTPSSR